MRYLKAAAKAFNLEQEAESYRLSLSSGSPSHDDSLGASAGGSGDAVPFADRDWGSASATASPSSPVSPPREWTLQLQKLEEQLAEATARAERAEAVMAAHCCASCVVFIPLEPHPSLSLSQMWLLCVYVCVQAAGQRLAPVSPPRGPKTVSVLEASLQQQVVDAQGALASFRQRGDAELVRVYTGLTTECADGAAPWRAGLERGVAVAVVVLVAVVVVVVGVVGAVVTKRCRCFRLWVIASPGDNATTT